MPAARRHVPTLWIAALLGAFALGSAAPAQEPLTLDADQQRVLGIQSETAKPATQLVLAHLPATVEAAFDSTAVVTVPYAGTVTGVSLLEGSPVQVGTPLARIQSRDVLALEAADARAGSAAELAASQAERDRKLLGEGIIAAARAQDSAARAKQAAASRREASQGLALAPRPARARPGEYELRAPIAGRILKRDVAPGQSVDALAAAFLVGSGDTVDVGIRVAAAQAAYTPRGTEVRVEGSAAKCHVIAVPLAADLGTQAIQVRARCTPSADLLPGQQVQASILPKAPAGALDVPRTALVRINQASGVYVVEGDRYRYVAVDVLGTAGDRVIVRGKLDATARIVTVGTSALKSLSTAG